MSRRLSARERATAAASLLGLRSVGIDTSEIERSAATMIRMGTPEPQAWGKAFSAVLDANPTMRPSLMRIEKLVERVDMPTLARYNVALEKAYTAGDDSDLRALAPSISQDLVQLARETGDAGFADDLPEVAGEPAPAPAPTDATANRSGWGATGFRPSEIPAETGD